MRAPNMNPLVKTVLGVSSALVCFVAARAADAMPSQIHLVYWNQDTSVRSSMDQFFGCLAKSSTFGSTWASQYSVAPVSYTGSYVLSAPTPNPVTLDANVTQILSDAITKGEVAAPDPGAANSYVFMVPSSVTTNDTSGATLCNGSGICGEHNVTTMNGVDVDIAVVPIDCQDCGGGIDAASSIAEHEAAEGIADLGTAQYEVGDGCEAQQNMTELQCCGTQYAIQQLAGSGGSNDCQTITPTGNACGCASIQGACTAASDCCSGLVCKAVSTDGGGSTRACCKDVGAKCTGDAECCGGTTCTSGVCAAPAPPPPTPSHDAGAEGGLTPPSGSGGGDAGTGNFGDGSAQGPGEFDGGASANEGGSNNESAARSGAGCACNTGGNGGGLVAPVLAILLVATLAVRRRRPRAYDH